MIGLPASGDIRQARAQAARALGPQISLLRGPLLAGVGAGHLAYATLVRGNVTDQGPDSNSINSNGAQPNSADPDSTQPDGIGVDGIGADAWDRPAGEPDQSRAGYAELMDRGHDSLERMRAQPRVADALRQLEQATERLDHQLEYVVDELHDLSEEFLGRLSLQTYTARKQAMSLARRLVQPVTPDQPEKQAERPDQPADQS